MKFIVDTNLKIIFGWSAKCGCSHVKNMYWYLNGKENTKLHTAKESCKLPNDIENYITILFIRNPYERLISGFLDKYKEKGQFRSLWKHNILTFSMFVDELLKKDWKMIEGHHFVPQTSESFDKIKLMKSKSLKIYDIKNIDYNYIEGLYNKTIPESVLNFRGDYNLRPKSSIKLEQIVYDLDMKLYYDFNVPNNYFYNDDIKKKVFGFYKNDFIFFKEYNFDYENMI
jgi:hypothetical protein